MTTRTRDPHTIQPTHTDLEYRMSNKTPILPADIRAGDTIRSEYSNAEGPAAYEYVAIRDAIQGIVDTTYFLLNRPVPPVVLPKVPGSVICWTDGAYLPQIAQLDAGHMDLGWFTGEDGDNLWYTDDQLVSYMDGAPFTHLRPEAEVLADILPQLLTIRYDITLIEGLGNILDLEHARLTLDRLIAEATK